MELKRNKAKTQSSWEKIRVSTVQWVKSRKHDLFYGGRPWVYKSMANQETTRLHGRIHGIHAWKGRGTSNSMQAWAERVERFYIAPWHCGVCHSQSVQGYVTVRSSVSFRFLIRHTRIEQCSPRKFRVTRHYRRFQISGQVWALDWMVSKSRADPEKTRKTTSTNEHISLTYKTLKIWIFLTHVLTITLHEALAHQCMMAACHIVFDKDIGLKAPISSRILSSHLSIDSSAVTPSFALHMRWLASHRLYVTANDNSASRVTDKFARVASKHETGTFL